MQEQLFIIYYLYCTKTDKGYVGLTFNFEDRMRRHFSEKKGYAIHRAIRKYSPEAFEIYKLEENIPEELAPDYEKQWAIILDTYQPNWYNISLCGDKPNLGRKHTEESREAIKAAWTPERAEELCHRNKSQAQRQAVTKYNNNRTLSSASRKKISNTLKAKPPTNSTGQKGIYFYSLRQKYIVRMTSIPTKYFTTLEEAIAYRNLFVVRV